MDYKGYRLTTLPNTFMVVIQPRGSGQIPHDLTGHFTTHVEAQKAIDRSLGALLNKGRKKNAPQGSTVTG